MLDCSCGGRMEGASGIFHAVVMSKGEPHRITFHDLKCWRCARCGLVVWDTEDLAKRVSDYRDFLARQRYEWRKLLERLERVKEESACQSQA